VGCSLLDVIFLRILASIGIITVEERMLKIARLFGFVRDELKTL